MKKKYLNSGYAGLTPARDPIHDPASTVTWAMESLLDDSLSRYKLFGVIVDEDNVFGSDEGYNQYLFIQNVPSDRIDTLGTGLLCTCPVPIVLTPAWTPSPPNKPTHTSVLTIVSCVPRPSIPASLAACISCSGKCGYTTVFLWRYGSWFGTMKYFWVRLSGPTLSGSNCSP
jgi:hypothetical protein